MQRTKGKSVFWTLSVLVFVGMALEIVSAAPVQLKTENKTDLVSYITVLTDPNDFGLGLISGCWPTLFLQSYSQIFHKEVIPTGLNSLCQILNKTKKHYLIQIRRNTAKTPFEFPILKSEIISNGQGKWSFNGTSQYTNEKIQIIEGTVGKGLSIIKNNLQIRTINGQDIAFYGDFAFYGDKGGMAVVRLNDFNTQTIQMYSGQTPNQFDRFANTFGCSNSHCVLSNWRNRQAEVMKINGTGYLVYWRSIGDCTNGDYVSISENDKFIATTNISNDFRSEGNVKIHKIGPSTLDFVQIIPIVQNRTVIWTDISAITSFEIRSYVFFKTFFTAGPIGWDKTGQNRFGRVLIFKIDQMNRFEIGFVISPHDDTKFFFGMTLTIVDNELMIIGTLSNEFYSILTKSIGP